MSHGCTPTVTVNSPQQQVLILESRSVEDCLKEYTGLIADQQAFEVYLRENPTNLGTALENMSNTDCDKTQ